MTVTGDEEVTVVLPPSRWLVALGPSQHPYEKAMKKLCRKMEENPAYVGWWSGSGHGQLLFHQANDANGTKTWSFSENEDTEPPDLLVTAQVDIRILDEDKPARGEAARAAKENLGRILNKTADHLGLKRPPGL